MFEGHLKATYPTRVNINYEVGDLYAFVDALCKTVRTINRQRACPLHVSSTLQLITPPADSLVAFSIHCQP
jgi:hypothetical protein